MARTAAAIRVETPAIVEGHRPRVLILGGGFAGTHAAVALAKLPVDITLIDRRNHFTFQPLLYQVALAVLSPANIASPIRGIVRHKPNVEVLMDEAVHFDLDERRAHLKSGAVMDYDYLMVATGATHSYFGHDNWAHYAPGLKTIEDAIEIRRRVLLAFELAERQMLETGSHPPLNFVVILAEAPPESSSPEPSPTSPNFICDMISATSTHPKPACCSSKGARASSPPILKSFPARPFSSSLISASKSTPEFR